MIINLSDLQSVIDKKKISASEKITLESLKKAKNIKKNFKFLKVLGEGEIKSKIQLEAYQISESAKSKIEKAGGSVSLLEVKNQVTK
jgi:large subunit ribosomal protein L15